MLSLLQTLHRHPVKLQVQYGWWLSQFLDENQFFSAGSVYTPGENGFPVCTTFTGNQNVESPCSEVIFFLVTSGIPDNVVIPAFK